MKKFFVVLATMLFAMQGLWAQQYSEWSDAELARANTAQNTSLSQQEKLVFLYCNLARMDGAKFMRTYAAKYLTGGSSYVSSLKRDLQQTKNRPMLYPEKDLCYTAALHAQDMGSHGMIGHNSSDGTDCFDRIGRYYKCGTAGENCSYGYSDALDIVMQLLIDDGTPSLGHRENILSASYNAMGTSIKTHKGYRYNCVQDFGAKILTLLAGANDYRSDGNYSGNDDSDDDYADNGNSGNSFFDDDDDFFDDSFFNNNSSNNNSSNNNSSKNNSYNNNFSNNSTTEIIYKKSSNKNNSSYSYSYTYSSSNNNSSNNNQSNTSSRSNSSSSSSNSNYNSANEITNAFNYLNAVRKNPARYSSEVGVNLSGVRPMHELKWNNTLAKVAQAKADDMARRDYMSHVDPDGYGINVMINAAGYSLRSDWCDHVSRNNFESIAAGSQTGKDAIILLLNDDGADNASAGHRRHLLGIDNFWANCYDIGIGMATGGSYGYYWCIIIAKHDF